MQTSLLYVQSMNYLTRSAEAGRGGISVSSLLDSVTSLKLLMPLKTSGLKPGLASWLSCK